MAMSSNEETPLNFALNRYLLRVRAIRSHFEANC